MRFVTLFPRADGSHIRKDVGMVGASLAAQYGWKSKLVCFDHGPMEALAGLEVEHIPGLGYKPRRPDWRVFRWIRKKASNIDILHLFHFNLENVLYGLWFKHCNPQGKLYLKLDLDPAEFTRNYLQGYPGYSPWARVDQWLRRRFLARCDLVTAETHVALDAFKRFAPELGARLQFMANGVDESFQLGADRVDESAVERQILVVGRLGAFQKNTELFLQALRLMEPLNWKVMLVGSTENEIAAQWARFLAECPAWSGRLEYRGQVQNRQELGQLFAQSALFCLPSRYESFGLVLAEALMAGCACVGTDIPTSRELIGASPLGILCAVEDAQGLADAINRWRSNDAWKNERAQRKEHARCFAWKRCILPIREAFQGV